MPYFIMVLMTFALVSKPVDGKIFNQLSRAKQTFASARTLLSNGRHSHQRLVHPAVVDAAQKPSRLARVAEVTSQSAVALTSLGTLFATITGMGKPNTVTVEKVNSFEKFSLIHFDFRMLLLKPITKSLLKTYYGKNSYNQFIY